MNGNRKRVKWYQTTLVRGVLMLGFFTMGTLVLWAATLKTPDLQSFEKRKIEQSTKIYDRTGETLLFDVHQNTKRTVIPLSDMSRHIKNATVAIEDADFYNHNGIKISAIFRAILVNLGAREFSQGGSTITQQVVKNSILTSEKKISRKLKEWALSLKLEQELSKETILELYLNESPYGGNIYGIEEASHNFFNKSAAELSLGESTYLAALPQAPTFYSPYGNNVDKLEDRKDLVLFKMLENGFISDDEYGEAIREKIEFKPQRDEGILAPHFVFFVREYIEKKYGKRAVEEQGFKVTTTLDYNLQKKAEEIVLRYATENEEKFNAENAALIAIDPKTGQILVMVGSRNYFDENIDGNFNVTLAHRQPGSAFKPFVYATAFNKGYTPETVVFDVRTQFQVDCEPDDLSSEDGCYSPVNYDNIFRGPVTFRDALAQSINVPSVKVLYLAGLVDSLRVAKDMGIESLTDANRYGLTLVLGGGEVSLLDITSAYGVFGNEGIRNTPVGILKIEDSNGNIIEEYRQRPSRVLSENTALIISDILSDNNARTPAFGARSPLYFAQRDVAVKTGTTNDYRDAWTIGYTPNLAVGAWAGNNDNSSMEKKVAGFIITPLWNEFMREALSVINDERFRKPKEENRDELKPVLKGLWRGGVSYTIDSISGKLATVHTPDEVKTDLVVPEIHSILYWINKKNPRGDVPTHPEKDSQFELWEYTVQEWKEKHSYLDQEVIIPTEYDDIHLPELSPQMSITNLNTNTVYSRWESITIFAKSSGRYPLTKTDFFINGVFVGSSKSNPFSLSFTPNNLDGLSSKNTIKVIGYDAVFNKGEYQTIFKVDL